MTAQRRIVVPGGVLARLAGEAWRAAPGECCGALLGEEAGGERRVRAVLPLPNTAPAGRYALSPDSLRGAEAVAVELGISVVGFYHSHPRGPAEPSPADLEAAWPWYTYMIVDGGAGTARAWRLAEDRSTFEAIVVVQEDGP